MGWLEFGQLKKYERIGNDIKYPELELNYYDGYGDTTLYGNITIIGDEICILTDDTDYNKQQPLPLYYRYGMDMNISDRYQFIIPSFIKLIEYAAYMFDVESMYIRENNIAQEFLQLCDAVYVAKHCGNRALVFDKFQDKSKGTKYLSISSGKKLIHNYDITISKNSNRFFIKDALDSSIWKKSETIDLLFLKDLKKECDDRIILYDKPAELYIKDTLWDMIIEFCKENNYIFPCKNKEYYNFETIAVSYFLRKLKKIKEN